ncbi:ACT domain-containing protein [Candidatus Micrarchaeota archaeon]|nr:ACT domain-containing protein [Candidatus Micrarchaeota archaeon]
MKKRLIVTARDRMGLIADLSYILGSAKINIEDINVVKVGQKVIIDMLVSNEAKARKLLEANGYNFIRSECLLIKLKDEPGALAEIAKLLADNKVKIARINVIEKGEGEAVLSLEVDKMKKARKLLKEWVV